MRGLRSLGLAVCASVAAPVAAVAADAPWQEVYRCAMFSDALAELHLDASRSEADVEKEFDRLLSTALYRHKLEYLKAHPAATPEELRSAWEAATDAVEKSFEADVDSASNAVGFLREGHDRCVPVRAGIVTDR